MKTDQSMTQVLSQAVIEAAKAAIMAVRETETPAESSREVQAALRTSGPALKQLIFDWKAQDTYNELNNCKIIARNTFSMNS